ncbi:MAG: hypothetical protein WC831_00015 [Parcubacteria group bacterium]|jgi:hypothetical protein
MEIDEKKLKKELLDGMEETFQRHVGILAEDFSTQLKGVADNVSGANKKLDSVMEMVAKNTEDIDVMKGNMNLVQSDIDVMKSDISTIKFDLKQKVDLDEFKSLEKRVLFLERKFSRA